MLAASGVPHPFTRGIRTVSKLNPGKQ